MVRKWLIAMSSRIHGLMNAPPPFPFLLFWKLLETLKENEKEEKSKSQSQKEEEQRQMFQFELDRLEKVSSHDKLGTNMPESLAVKKCTKKGSWEKAMLSKSHYEFFMLCGKPFTLSFIYDSWRILNNILENIILRCGNNLNFLLFLWWYSWQRQQELRKM